MGDGHDGDFRDGTCVDCGELPCVCGPDVSGFEAIDDEVDADDGLVEEDLDDVDAMNGDLWDEE